MDNGKLYHSSNQFQRFDASKSLSRCPALLKWKSSDKNPVSCLDIGCGTGDVTIDFVLPILPKNFERLVGVDLSNDLINFARENYSLPRVSFEQFDLGLELEIQNLRNIGQFDHITSFYCLQWVPNQKVALQNIHKLLKPGGDMFSLIAAKHPVYDVFKTLSMNDEWAEYMTDVDSFISPYSSSSCPATDFQDLLQSNGFTECNVFNQQMSFAFNGIEDLKSKF